jgi:inosose dehydratase
MQRVAAAPISWGICEVPGWGVQLPPRRVLGEMQSLGITATELGSLGWLPTDPGELRQILDEFGMSMIGGFVPLVAHDLTQRRDMIAAAREAATTLQQAGGSLFVSAMVSSSTSWDRLSLTTDEWDALLGAFAIVDEICGEFGLRQVMHPHVNTMIETADEMQRFLDGCESSFCLDTGHLFIGGADPVTIAEESAHRVGLVHIKDVNASIAARMRAGEFTLMTATQAGLFPSAGSGDVPIAATIAALEAARYRGWYVLEQDVALMGEDPPVGQGPVLGVKESIEYLQMLAA